MSKKAKIILLGVSFSMLLSIGVLGATNDNSEIMFNSIIEKYTKKSEKEIEKDLKTLSKQELIGEINSVAAGIQNINKSNILIPFVDELFQRKNEFENVEIIDTINDSTSSIITKEIMVDLYTVKNENKSKNNEIKKLLKQNNIDDQIKSRIVINSKFDANDVILLKDLIKESDGILFFNSLKKLSTIDNKESYKIAKEILSNYNSQSKQKVSAALKATSKYLKDNKSNDKGYVELEENFIKLGLEILNNNDDNFLKDAAFFSLSDLMSEKSISEIINAEFISTDLKRFAIYQNFNQLKKMLTNNPTESEIEIVVQGMKTIPIKDLVEDLEIVTKDIKNQNLKKACEEVIEDIKLNGINANTKWINK